MNLRDGRIQVLVLADCLVGSLKTKRSLRLQKQQWEPQNSLNFITGNSTCDKLFCRKPICTINKSINLKILFHYKELLNYKDTTKKVLVLVVT
jgi:hypothetical protein